MHHSHIRYLLLKQTVKLTFRFLFLVYGRLIIGKLSIFVNKFVNKLPQSDSEYSYYSLYLLLLPKLP